MKFHQGKYRPKNPEKYKGAIKDVIYRSSWELATMVWLDRNDKVEYWSSEELIIPYAIVTEGVVRRHRYFPDFLIKFTNDTTYVIEVKPESQVREPKPRKRTTRKYLMEYATYQKNISKWRFAMEYCRDRNWIFQIWSEPHLARLGICIV